MGFHFVSQRGRLMSISRRSSSWAWTPAGLGIMAGVPSWAGVRGRAERGMKIVLAGGLAGGGCGRGGSGGGGVGWGGGWGGGGGDGGGGGGVRRFFLGGGWGGGGGGAG